MAARITRYRREAAVAAPGAKPSWSVAEVRRTYEILEGTYPSGMKEAQVKEVLAPFGSLGGHFTAFSNGHFRFTRNTD